jgi:hypothetical protein
VARARIGRLLRWIAAARAAGAVVLGRKTLAPLLEVCGHLAPVLLERAPNKLERPLERPVDLFSLGSVNFVKLNSLLISSGIVLNERKICLNTIVLLSIALKAMKSGPVCIRLVH